jgi:hypothetical protein
MEGSHDLAHRLREAAVTGDVLELMEDEVVPAEMLREALVATDEGRPRRWIALVDATVRGELDLAAAELTCGLRASDCVFTGDVVMTDASLPRLVLEGCLLPALYAGGTTVRGNVELDGSNVSGHVRLDNANVAGSVVLTAARISGRDAPSAFNGDGMTVTGSFIAVDLVAEGEVRLMGATVGGQCQFGGAELTGETALAIERIAVADTVLLDMGFHARGLVRMLGADISGQLLISEASFDGRGDAAISLDGARIGADLQIDDTTFEGRFLISGARVLGNLTITGGSFSDSLDAFTASRLRVRDDLVIQGGTKFSGLTAFFGLFVGGSLSIEDARFEPGTEAIALVLDGARIERNLEFHQTNVGGPLRLLNATVVGRLLMVGGHLEHRDGEALAGDNLDVGGPAVFGGGLQVTGGLRLLGSQFGDSLSLEGATLHNPNRIALDLERVRVAGLLFLLFDGIDGLVDLTGATVAAISDDPSVWPDVIRLGGLTYDRIQATPVITVAERLAWIRREEGGYIPQPYTALAAAYRAAGYEELARRVLVAERRQRRKELAQPSKAWDWLLDRGIGYGYATWRAAVGLVVLAALGAVVFTAAQPEHFTATKSGSAQPSFHALIYTLDVLVPVVNLRQREAWTPDGYALWWSVGLTFLGWVLTTAVVAALTGLLRRE